MSFQEPPLLSILTPMQAALWVGRALGRGSQMMRGLMTRWASEELKAKVFAGYTPAPHDVFVTCFSKSGTNWAMQLFAQISHRGAAEFGHIHEIVAWPEAVFPDIVPLDDLGPVERSPTKLRGIKTASAATYVPYSPVAKYLGVIRDPKDVCVSAYYFLTGVFGMREQITLDIWVDIVLGEEGLIRRWPTHLDSFWRMRDRPNVLLLEFAEMKRSLPDAVDAVAELLEVELGEDERAEVIRRAGFEYMKAHEDCFCPPRLRLLTGKQRGQMLRSGQVGGSKQRLSTAQRERIDALMLAELERLGSDFPYAERFMS